MDLEEVSKGAWPRVKAPEFPRNDFLDFYNHKHATLLGRVDPVVDDNSLELTYACWCALFNLKDHYKTHDRREYGFTYLKMANLLLSSKIYPKGYYSKNRSERQEFQKNLISILQRNATEFSENKDRLYKWTLIAGARLCMDYLQKFFESKHEQDFLRDAYILLKEANKLRTTKTVYLLLAELVEDFNYRHEGWSQEKAENKVKGWYKKALKQRESSPTKSETKTPKGNYDLSQIFAKPTYMNKVPVGERVKILLASLKQEGEKKENFHSSPDQRNVRSSPGREEPSFPGLLEGYDYKRLIIPIRLPEEDLDEMKSSSPKAYETEEDQKQGDDSTGPVPYGFEESKEFPAIEQLRTLYPRVKQPTGRTYDDDWIRKILYASEHLKLKNKDISMLEWVNVGEQRISEILCVNGCRKKGPRFTEEDLEELYGAYFQYCEELRNRTITKRQMAEALAKKIGQPEKLIVKKYHDFSGKRAKDRAKESLELIKEKTEQIVSMYKKKVSIYVIHKETNFSLNTIFKILSEKVKKDERHRYLDLAIQASKLGDEKEKLTKEGMEDVIVKKFRELKGIREKLNLKSKRVPAADVAGALQKFDIGRGKSVTPKIVQGVLKRRRLYQPLRQEAVKAPDEQLSQSQKSYHPKGSQRSPRKRARKDLPDFNERQAITTQKKPGLAEK